MGTNKLDQESGFGRNEVESLKRMFENAPVYVCLLEGPEHRLKYMNKIFRQLYGGVDLPEGTSAEKILSEFKGADEEEIRERIQLLDSIYNSGEAFIANEFQSFFGYRGDSEPGEAFFNLMCQPMKDEKGEVYGLLINGYEVTDHVRARQEKAYSKKRLTLAMEGADVGFWESDLKNERLDYTNAQCKAHFGYSAGEEFTVEDFYNTIDPEDRPLVRQERKNAVENREEYAIEYRVYWPDNSKHWILARGQVLRDENDEPYRFIGITIDITESKEAEEKLKEAVRIRDEFLAIASHELQTPVTSVRTQSELLELQLKRDGEQEYAGQAAKINKGINQLSKFIANLLDFSRMQEGKLQLEKGDFSLNEVIKERVEAIQPITDHDIVVESENDISVYGDEFRIGQVITNLLNNAIKYSPEPEKIIVRAEEEQNKVTVSVVDFGVGVSEHERETIFQRFYKGDKPLKTTYPGFGIGLFISSQIVEQHGGDIWVEDNNGKGSEFKFTIPEK